MTAKTKETRDDSLSRILLQRRGSSSQRSHTEYQVDLEADVSNRCYVHILDCLQIWYIPNICDGSCWGLDH